MADGRHVGKYSKCHNSPAQWTDWDATWVVTSHHVPDMSAIMGLPWQRPLPSNRALNIQQLWASGGRTREPIDEIWYTTANSDNSDRHVIKY